MGGYSGGYGDCCPLVVDPLTLAALLGFIAAATAFLNTVITMNIMGRRKRRMREASAAWSADLAAGAAVDLAHSGEQLFSFSRTPMGCICMLD